MRIVWSILALFLALCFTSLASAASTIKMITTQTLEPSRRTDSIGARVNAMDIGAMEHDPTYMLSLRCPLSTSEYISSRIAVLRTHLNDGNDYAIISGHGLPTQSAEVMSQPKSKGCFVMDFSGNRQAVDGFALSESYAAGTRTDWGVIRFKAMPTQNLVRYNLPNISWESIKNSPVPARFAFACGLRDHNQNCEILPSRYQVLTGKQFDGVMAHNCRAIGGQSGSPLSLSGDKDDLLLGIHLGRTWMLKSPVTGRPEFQGFVRVIDGAMVDEINTLVERLP